MLYIDTLLDDNNLKSNDSSDNNDKSEKIIKLQDIGINMNQINTENKESIILNNINKDSILLTNTQDIHMPPPPDIDTQQSITLNKHEILDITNDIASLIIDSADEESIMLDDIEKDGILLTDTQDIHMPPPPDIDTQQSITLNENEILDITDDIDSPTIDADEESIMLDDIEKDGILLTDTQDIHMPPPPDIDTQQSITLNEHEILDITDDIDSPTIDADEESITLDTAMLDDIDKDGILLTDTQDIHMPPPPDIDTQQSITLNEHEILDITDDIDSPTIDADEESITLDTAMLDDIDKDGILLTDTQDIHMPSPPDIDTQQSITLNEHEILDITDDIDSPTIDADEESITLDTAMLDDIDKDGILLTDTQDIHMPSPPDIDTQQSITLNEHEILDITDDIDVPATDTDDIDSPTIDADEESITLDTAMLDDIEKDGILLIDTQDIHMPPPPDIDTQQSITLNEHEILDITDDIDVPAIDTDDIDSPTIDADEESITLDTAMLDDIEKDGILLIDTQDIHMPPPPDIDTQQSITLNEHEILDITDDIDVSATDTDDIDSPTIDADEESITLDTAMLDDIDKDGILLTDTQDIHMPSPPDIDTQQSITLNEHEILDITDDIDSPTIDADEESITLDTAMLDDIDSPTIDADEESITLDTAMLDDIDKDGILLTDTQDIHMPSPPDIDTQQSITLNEHEILDITDDIDIPATDTDDIDSPTIDADEESITLDTAMLDDIDVPAIDTDDIDSPTIDADEESITLDTAMLDDIDKDGILLTDTQDIHMPSPPDIDTQQSITLNEHEILDITDDIDIPAIDTDDIVSPTIDNADEESITLDTAMLDDIDVSAIDTDDIDVPAIDADEESITLDTAMLDDIDKDGILLTDTQDIHMPSPPDIDTQQSITLNEHEILDITDDIDIPAIDTDDIDVPAIDADDIDVSAIDTDDIDSPTIDADEESITLDTAMLDDIDKDGILLTDIQDIHMPSPPDIDTQQSITLNEHEILDITDDIDIPAIDTDDIDVSATDTDDIDSPTIDADEESITLDTAMLDDIDKDGILLTDTQDIHMSSPPDIDTQQSITLNEHEILDITDDIDIPAIDTDDIVSPTIDADDSIEHLPKYTNTVPTGKNHEPVDILYKYLEKIPKEFKTTYTPKDNLMKELMPQDEEIKTSNFNNSDSKYEYIPSSSNVQSELSPDTDSGIMDTKSQEYEIPDSVESPPSQDNSEEQKISQNNITLTSDNNESEHPVTFSNIDMEDTYSYVSLHTPQKGEMSSIKLLDKDVYNQINAVDEQLTHLEIRVVDYIDEKKYFQLQLKRIVDTKVALHLE